LIPFDFEYVRPPTAAEAAQLFADAASCGKTPFYMSGGTEFISLARRGQLQADVVIDLKGIAACHTLESGGGCLRIGAAVTLNRIAEAAGEAAFPLLAAVCKGIADHTSRNKITVGANLASRLPYKEAALPLLLGDSRVVIAAAGGERVAPLHELLQRELQLQQGEFLIRIELDRQWADCPHAHLKRTQVSKLDYPLVSIAALKAAGRIRAAFSGVCPFPFRSFAVEAALNERTQPVAERVRRAVAQAPAPLVDDSLGSREYRAFVWQRALQQVVETLEGVDG
jgi:CO/xanthine dehydrogenase FAD-binding subunit